MSAFADANATPPRQIWAGVEARSVHTEGVTLAVIELAPGAVVPKHRHPNEQAGVLLRGSLSFTIGAEQRELEAGAMWRIAADVAHEVHAGPLGASLVEAFSPARVEWAALPEGEPSPLRWTEQRTSF
jgi:quercetin dioxygenase-like cupin family protein